MKNIPESENALVIRTNFSDDKQWESIKTKIAEPVGDFQANVEFIDDKEYDGLTPEKVAALLEEDSEHEFIFLVDKITMENPENLVLCVDLYENPGDSFRVIPTEMWAVENNLSLANMEFEAFKDALDSDNVFRGFSK